MQQGLIKEILPELLLEHFTIVNYTKSGLISSKKIEFEIELDEINELPKGYNNSEYESKGFKTQIGWIVDKENNSVRFYNRNDEIERAMEEFEHHEESIKLKMMNFEKKVIKESSEWLRKR
ncbi:MAG: hypothetical protein ACI8XB_000672 [Patiriisocius sp.]